MLRIVEESGFCSGKNAKTSQSRYATALCEQLSPVDLWTACREAKRQSGVTSAYHHSRASRNRD